MARGDAALRSVAPLRSFVARRAPARSCARRAAVRHSSVVIRSSVLASRAVGIAGARRLSPACLFPASRRRAPLRAFLSLFLAPLSSLWLACSSLPGRAALLSLFAPRPLSAPPPPEPPPATAPPRDAPPPKRPERGQGHARRRPEPPRTADSRRTAADSRRTAADSRRTAPNR